MKPISNKERWSTKPITVEIISFLDLGDFVIFGIEQLGLLKLDKTTNIIEKTNVDFLDVMDNNIYGIDKDMTGSIWFGGRTGIACSRPDTTYFYYGFTGNFGNVISVKNKIFTSSISGLIELTNKQVTIYPASKSHIRGKILEMELDSLGNL